jgi:hypothetical protein
MIGNARKTGAAVEANFQFLMWLVPAIEKFPRTQKFLLGDRIQITAFESRHGKFRDFADAHLSPTATASIEDRSRHASATRELPILFDFAIPAPTFEYDDPQHLLASLGKITVAPEAKMKALKEALEEGRRRIETELIKPR